MTDDRRTIVVGDIHGCADELDRLLKKLDHGRDDRLVLVGDLVARGPDSVGVVDRARELGALVVRGNHEVIVLRWWEARRAGAEEPRVAAQHRSVVETLNETHWGYLEALPWFLRLEDIDGLVVHAGMLPGLPPEKQDPMDLVYVRSIRLDGSGSRRIDEGRPWASAWAGPEHVMFGHDALRRLQLEPWATGLDTGCVYGDRLSALVIEPGETLAGPHPARRVVSVKARKEWYAGGGGRRD
ncbi:MAG: serine/threonine protein phosphatase [Deltaproteobacteria bacterium]|nr:serine/threonine protein phosphatase [Deltaproteobacteria bacterium]